MVVIRDPKSFDFDWLKNVDENLKYEIEFIIKNESLAENKMKKRN